MKKLFILLALVSSTNLIGQITVQSSCTAPDSTYWKYRKDADKMTVRYAYHINNSYMDSIPVNKQLRDRYLQALLAVYNATAIPARDSVVNVFNIHIFGYDINQIVIRVDSNLQWIKNVKAHVIPCGEPKMDYLMNKYSLKEVKHYPHLLNPTTDVILESDSTWNTQPLADTIKKISGVFLASGGISGGIDGNRIEDSLTTNYTWLVYSVGWDDGMPYGYPCYTGCTYRKFWQFKIYNDCSVEYGGTFGAPLNVGIEENKLDSDKIKVYPNPAGNIVNINFEFNQTQSIRIEITNSLGQLLITENKVMQKQEINLSGLPPGLYSVKIKSEFSVRTIKLIKE